MDDKRDGKKKEKKRSRSRSRSRDGKRRSPSRSPSYGTRRRRDRSRSRDRQRRRSPRSPEIRRRGRGRRSPSPPPPPSLQAPPPPMIAGGVPAAGYPMYDAYGGYSAPAPGPYMGDMSQQYGAYEYRAPPGPAPVAVDGYGGMLAGPPPQIMMVGQPGPPGEDYNAAAAAAGWSAPPPALPVVQETEEEKRKREAAIASEVRNQRASLKKQRDDYKQRAGALKRELKILKQQRTDLSSGREPPSPTTNSFIKENDKLQSQIQTKLSTIENVIDMLEGIIGKDKSPTPPPPPISRTPEPAADAMNVSPPAGKERKGSVSSSASPERLKNEVLETMKRAKMRKEDKSSIKQEKPDADSKPGPPLAQVNHVFYDPELHWCATCDIFPKTAKDYLNHLHTEQHAAKAAAAVQEYPWRDKLPDADEPQNNPALPPKRTPIRGLQFFVPAPAWYCKLCNYWMGDLHCASMHLKSSKHREGYGQFIESHANFEIDWMSDRQKAYERMRDSDRHGHAASTTTPYAPDSVPKGEVDFLTGNLLSKDAAKAKKKSKKEDKKDKKKKKRSKKKKKRASSSSSSSSSDSDSDPEKKGSKGDEFDPATSIRVAMRNILKAQEAASKESKQAEEAAAGKWTVVQPAVPPKELTAPPPPFMTDGAESREKKRDELMISQWVTPDPIISEKEKQMLEQLKGKLKKRDDGPPPLAPPCAGRFQEPERDNFHREADDRRRSKSVTPPWRRGNRGSPGRRGSPGFGRGRRSPPFDRRGRDRSRDRDMNRGGGMGGGRFDRRRGRRSPSVSPSRSPGGRFDRRRGSPVGRFDRRRSPSPNFARGRFRPRRSFSRSRSRSRGRRVIEKPVVNFPPEPKPKPAKKPRDKKEEEKKDKKPVSMSISGQKKLPFIGRMPVFKKQQQDAKKEELSATENPDAEHSAGQENGIKTQPEEFVDMMPDPYQYAAMCAPPPPPSGHPGKPDQNILPPGIDEAEADHVPKPISDAPIPRKGPLPKDFQQALDILFDGDKPKPAEVIANETKPPELPPPPPVAPPMDTDQPQMIVPEAIEIYNQQIAAQYSTAVVSGAAVSYDDEAQNRPLEMSTTTKAADNKSPTRQESPEASVPAGEEDAESKNGAPEPEVPVAAPKVEVENEETRRKRAELEELAMLGIDADDMAAQIF